MSLLLCNFDLGGLTGRKSGSTVFRLVVTNLHTEPLRFLVEFHHRPSVQVVNISGKGAAVRYKRATKVVSIHSGYYADPDVVTGWSLALDPKEAGELSVRAADESYSPSISKAGHVVLRLPTGSGAGAGFRLAAQAAKPVPVLVSATRLDYRSTYQTGIGEPSGMIPYHMAAPDDLATSEVPLSTGRSLNEVEPESMIVGSVRDIRDILRAEGRDGDNSVGTGAETGVELWEPEQRVLALLQLLDGLDPSQEVIGAINEVLADHATRVRLASGPH